MNHSIRLLEEMGLGPVWISRTPASSITLHNSYDTPHIEAETLLVEHSLLLASANNPDSSSNRSLAISKMEWPQLTESIKTCTACRLCESRTQAVPGVGDEKADWLIVGEAPGAEEDRRGEPFVGRAGQLLDNMLAALGLKRGRNVYIANVLKCRPPGNRDPELDEIAACRLYLERQIELIAPKLILCVGRFAANTLLGRDDKVGQLRGQVHDYRGTPLIVSYHPAYLLRNPADKAKAWQDLIRAKRALAAS